MKSHIPALGCLCLFFASFSWSVKAEGLDDASIRKLYADRAATIGDAKKAREFMEKTLTDDYTGQTQTIQLVNGTPPTTNLEFNTKAQEIDSMVESFQSIKDLKIDYQVENIKYSDDHKYAFVTVVSKLLGTEDSPTPSGKISTIHVDDAKKCLEKIALQGVNLKILEATCSDKTTMN